MDDKTLFIRWCAGFVICLFGAFPQLFAEENSVREMRYFPSAITDRDFHEDGAPSPAKVTLGQFLFFDKILGGNRSISCATCHHPLAATSDGLSLGAGEGGRGLGVTRDTGHGASRIPERVPRNSPAIFNLGARAFRVMFHDGRLVEDVTHPSGFRSPAGDDLPPGLDNALAAQAMFPVTSAVEMAGAEGENPVADAAAEGRLAGPGGVWDLLAGRLRIIPEYVELFRGAFPDISAAGDITFVHTANAIAAFEATAYRADGSAFDLLLRGDFSALSRDAYNGMRLFYGSAGCSRCHTGRFMTDLEYHAVTMPQIGPGKGDGRTGMEDYGRERVTGLPADRYRFRTPALRNVAITGPWGHAGAFDDLREVVRHFAGPIESFRDYDPRQAVLPSRRDLDERDFLLLEDPEFRAALEATNELEPRHRIRERQIDQLVAFLQALTDPRSLDMRRSVPKRVPSGFSLAE